MTSLLAAHQRGALVAQARRPVDAARLTFNLPPHARRVTLSADQMVRVETPTHPDWEAYFAAHPHVVTADVNANAEVAKALASFRGAGPRKATIYFGAGTDGGRVAAFGAPLTFGIDARTSRPDGTLPERGASISYYRSFPDLRGYKHLYDVGATGYLQEVLGGFARFIPGFRPRSLTLFKEGTIFPDPHGMLTTPAAAVHFKLLFDDGPGTPQREYVHLTGLVDDKSRLDEAAASSNYIIGVLDAIVRENLVDTCAFKAGMGINALRISEDLTLRAARAGAVVLEGRHAPSASDWEFSRALPRAEELTVLAPWGYGSWAKLWRDPTPSVRP